MTNDSYTDKRQALTQILGILDAIAVKKANGEKIRKRNHTESVKKADGENIRIRYHREGTQEQPLSEQAAELTNKASKAFQEGRYDDAKKYLHGVLEIIDQLPDNNDHREAKAYMLNMLAGAECRQGLFDESVKHLREAIAVCEQLPDEIKYLYAKETFEDNLEEVEHKMKQEKEASESNATESDDSLLESLQSKSGNYKKQSYKSQKDTESNSQYKKEEPKDFGYYWDKYALWVCLAVIILIILTSKYCK